MAIRGFGIGDMGWIIMRQGALYSAHEGFDATFETLGAEIFLDFAHNRDPKTDRGWIARIGTRRVGCIFCTRLSPDTAKLRLFLVEPEAHGTGLGQRLLDTCLAHARSTGAARMVL